MKFDIVLTQLAQLWGVDLPIGSDAMEIIDSQDDLWILECSEQSDIFTLYTHLNIIVDPNNMGYWLNINMQRSLLSSCWIGLDEGRFCLGLSLPMDKIDHVELNNTFENMFLIKQQLYLLESSDKKSKIVDTLMGKNRDFQWC